MFSSLQSSAPPPPPLPAQANNLATRDQIPRPYWNEQVAAWSQRLWLPTELDSVASTALRSSWFSQATTHRPRIPQAMNSLKSSRRKPEDKGGESNEPDEGKKRKAGAMLSHTRKKRKIEGLMRSLKVRVYPNARQKELMKRWMGCARLVYNMVVEASRGEGAYASLAHFRDLRHQRIADGTWAFMAEVPYNILDETLKEAIQARDLVQLKNQEARAAGQRPNHRLSFRRRKEPRQTVTIRQQNCADNLKFYPRKLHTRAITAIDPLHPRRKDPARYPPLHHEHRKRNHNWPNVEGRVTCDSKLMWDRSQRQWTFVWVYEKERVTPHENQVGGISACSLDPGVRTFITWYSPTHGAGYIGNLDAQKLVRLFFHLDKLTSRAAMAPSRRRRRRQRACARIRQRIHNLIDEIHRKSALWLVRKFDVIIIPPFNAGRMARRRMRKINSKTVRTMMTWAHGRFRERLVSKAEELGREVKVVGEAYTSKTCSRCGWIHATLGGRKVFCCRACGLRIDRDVNGARGIFLRALLDGAISLEMQAGQ